MVFSFITHILLLKEIKDACSFYKALSCFHSVDIFFEWGNPCFFSLLVICFLRFLLFYYALLVHSTDILVPCFLYCQLHIYVKKTPILFHLLYPIFFLSYLFLVVFRKWVKIQNKEPHKRLVDLKLVSVLKYFLSRLCY